MKKDLKTYTRDAKHFSCQLYSIVCGCLGHRLERGWERGCWDAGEETHTSSWSLLKLVSIESVMP